MQKTDMRTRVHAQNTSTALPALCRRCHHAAGSPAWGGGARGSVRAGAGAGSSASALRRSA